LTFDSSFPYLLFSPPMGLTAGMFLPGKGMYWFLVACVTSVLHSNPFASRWNYNRYSLKSNDLIDNALTVPMEQVML
jgi:hypothetical protein